MELFFDIETELFEIGQFRHSTVCKQKTILLLNWIEIGLFRHSTVCKQKTVLLLNWIVLNTTIYMYKNGFGMNNQQRLTCHKTKPNRRYIRKVMIQI